MTRDRGEGSIYRQRSGLWAGAYVLPDGQRKYFYAKTKNEVAEKLRVFRIRVERGIYKEDTKQTVGEYLTWWLDDQKRQLANETWRKYESSVRLHLMPDLQDMRLNKLSPMHVRQLTNKKLDSGLSSRSVNNLYDVLHSALERARKMELVERNVANLVDPPRMDNVERRSLTAAQANLLLETLKVDRSYALFRTLLTLGLRPGEGLGLRWKSIDFEKGRVRIDATLQRHEGQWILKGPKTAASVKTLPLPRPLVDTLARHREAQAIERKAAGPMWTEWGLCFPRPHGLPTWGSEAGRQLQVACRTAGIPEVTLHSLRHTTPSILLGLGVDQRVIMQVLRHSTILLTANLYTHVVDPLVQDAVDRIDEVFGS